MTHNLLDSHKALWYFQSYYSEDVSSAILQTYVAYGLKPDNAGDIYGDEPYPIDYVSTIPDFKGSSKLPYREQMLYVYNWALQFYDAIFAVRLEKVDGDKVWKIFVSIEEAYPKETFSTGIMSLITEQCRLPPKIQSVAKELFSENLKRGAARNVVLQNAKIEGNVEEFKNALRKLVALGSSYPLQSQILIEESESVEKTQLLDAYKTCFEAATFKSVTFDFKRPFEGFCLKFQAKLPISNEENVNLKIFNSFGFGPATIAKSKTKTDITVSFNFDETETQQLPESESRTIEQNPIFCFYRELIRQNAAVIINNMYQIAFDMLYTESKIDYDLVPVEEAIQKQQEVLLREFARYTGVSDANFYQPKQPVTLILADARTHKHAS